LAARDINMVLVHAPQPLTSIEAFALALVEASSRLNATDPTAAGEPTTHPAPHADDTPPAVD